MNDFERNLLNGKTGRHETFTPRYGWLKKGYEKAKSNPHVFNDKNDIEQLGVGKNMVRSIRYWCQIFRILEPAPDKAEGSKKGNMQPTIFGRFLFDDDNGGDPFLEDIATLWLLHWQLFTFPYKAVTWPIAFSFCNMSSFDQQLLIDGIIAAKSRFGSGQLTKISQNSFAKDASCILRMYSPNHLHQNEIRCPFQQLELILPTQDKRTFTFNLSDKPSLQPLIFLACCIDYANAVQPSTLETISLSRIAHDPSSPGVAFKLSETYCGEKLDAAIRLLGIPGLELIENNGIRQLSYSLNTQELFWTCLKHYYRHH